MSATNGGRGTPPVPPEGHGPLAEQFEIPISKEVVYQFQNTEARREGNGGVISFLVIEAGMPVKHSYLIAEQGKKRLLEELSGGLTLS
jgi:hypothetical protein